MTMTNRIDLRYEPALVAGMDAEVKARRSQGERYCRSDVIRAALAGFLERRRSARAHVRKQ